MKFYKVTISAIDVTPGYGSYEIAVGFNASRTVAVAEAEQFAEGWKAALNYSELSEIKLEVKIEEVELAEIRLSPLTTN